jgi:beta-aspartyl-peptidase (threonine type)
MDAVEQAIKSLELDDNYNAGYGSVLTSEGDVEMDACIMDGKTMKVGAVTGVKNIYNPITLSRRVMEKTRYNFLGSEGAMNLAYEEKFPIQKPGSLISPRSLASWNEWKNRQNMTLQEMTGEGGTVGCVAIDSNGNIVAGTSTGNFII